MKVKVESLTGNALIWAVCAALGESPVLSGGTVVYRSPHGSWVSPRYTQDSLAGELIVSERIGVSPPTQGESPLIWRTRAKNRLSDDSAFAPYYVEASSESLAVAVCRAIVLSRLGEEADVPDELVCGLQKGDHVFVNFTDGSDDENYTGPAVFVRHIPLDECSMYGDGKEPHSCVKTSPSDVGSTFPTRSIFGQPK